MRFWKIRTQMMTVLLGAMLACSGAAQAIDFSFQGSFHRDDDVQLFAFAVGAPSIVTLRAWSYAGGLNAAGDTIARGGFDTILALFDSTGALINQNDDGGCGLVAADALTGQCWDTFLSSLLAVGTYTVSIMQFNNFANGPNLSDGFIRTGDGNFTSGNGGDCAGVAFCDVSGANPGAQRDNHWAFDVLNVEQAQQQDVPEPSTFALFGVGFLTLLGYGWRRGKKAACKA